MCGAEGVNHVDGIGEENAYTLLAGGVTKRGGEMGFAEADGAQEDDVGLVMNELESEEILDLKAVDFLGPVPAEGVEGFDDGEACRMDAPGDGTVGTQGGLAFDELGEVDAAHVLR